jgi:hypothetical protein
MPRGLNVPRSRLTPPEAPDVDAENVVHAPIEEVAEAAPIAVSSPTREAHPEGSGDVATEPPPSAAAEAEV